MQEEKKSPLVSFGSTKEERNTGEAVDFFSTDSEKRENSFCRAARQKFLSIGYGNFVLPERLVAIVNPASSPMRRLREEARSESRLIDATQGRKTRAILIMDSNHIILSAIQAETLTQRLLQQEREGK